MSAGRNEPPAGPVALLATAELATQSGVAQGFAGAELNVNLVVLLAGTSVEAHVNDAVEVSIVVLAGTGYAEIDGQRHTLAPGAMLLIPLGARRELGAQSSRFVYVTCHRRRPPLAIKQRADRAPRG